MFNDVALRVLVAIQSLALRSRNEDGQTLAEYSLIISAIAVAAITIAVLAFREAVVDAFNSASACLADPSSC